MFNTQHSDAPDIFTRTGAKAIESSRTWWRGVNAGDAVCGILVRDFTIPSEKPNELPRRSLELAGAVVYSAIEANAPAGPWAALDGLNVNVTAMMQPAVARLRLGDAVGVAYMGEQDTGKESAMRVYRIYKLTNEQHNAVRAKCADLPF